ncbi:hypothetical protein GCM10009549_23510 [Streptomyces thermoalcalitolerans]|uniref:Uncharacterized protein n=1 Tax=Streptomyces thermoalcalitolerans TaxID=65605 RepID=A0ABN1NMM8_9ACTN
MAGEAPIPAGAAPPQCPSVGLWWNGHRLDFLRVVTSFGGRPGSPSPRLDRGSLDRIALESFLPADVTTGPSPTPGARTGGPLPSLRIRSAHALDNGMRTTKGRHHDITPDRGHRTGEEQRPP